MPEKRETPEGAERVVLQDPRDKAKADCLNPNPQRWNTHTRCYSAYNAALPGAARSRFAGRHLRLARRWLAKPLKGMSGAPTSRSTRSAPTERGIAYRTRVPGRRSPRSSQRWGKPITGQRGTGGAVSQKERVRNGQLPDLSGRRPTGELLEIERLTSSSGRGRRKSAAR
jgi:hypothetical protein